MSGQIISMDVFQLLVIRPSQSRFGTPLLNGSLLKLNSTK